MDPLTITVVVPVYSGEDYLEVLAGELGAVRREWEQQRRPFRLLELIFVDDAARDESSAVLERIAARHDWVKVITLSRNFGQHPATIAGILYSSGNWVVTMDEDLQHPPSAIIELLRTVARTGADIVYASPCGHVHGSMYRDLASRGVKKLVGVLTRNPMVEHFNSFRLIRGSIARAAASVCGYETYLDVAFSWFSLRFETFPLTLRDKRHMTRGSSSYGLRRLRSHSRRLFVSSQTRLLRLGAVLGVAAMLLAAALALHVLFTHSVDPSAVEVRGWRSLFVAILFFGGVCAFLIGVLIEYATSLVLHVQGKPTFFVVDRSADEILRRHFEAGG